MSSNLPCYFYYNLRKVEEHSPHCHNTGQRGRCVECPRIRREDVIWTGIVKRPFRRLGATRGIKKWSQKSLSYCELFLIGISPKQTQEFLAKVLVFLQFQSKILFKITLHFQLMYVLPAPNLQIMTQLNLLNPSSNLCISRFFASKIYLCE